MLSIYKSILIITVVFCLFSACNSVNKSNIEKIQIEQIEYEKHTGDCIEPFTDPCASIKIVFSKIKYDQRKDIETKINEYIMNRLLEPVFAENKFETIEDKMTSFIEEYKNFQEDFPDANQMWEYEMIGDAKVVFDKIICLEFENYSYLGGAHPNSTTFFTNFDLNNGKEINLDDLFIENYKRDLNKIAEIEFRKSNELGENDKLDEVGFWFDNNVFTINKNFALDSLSITFYYNSYEIAPYAFGPTAISLPYKNIAHLLNKNGVLAELAE